MSGDLGQFFTNDENTNYTTAAPKAFLNYVAFDNQLNEVSANSGVVQVPTITGSEQAQPLVAPEQIIQKDGYIYIYVSNESAQKVFFDNLVVHRNRGPILQTDSYYPFGLTMAGISDQAALSTENNYLYNGKLLNHKEFSDNTGLDWYSYGMREYDPQIGKFFRVDPLAEKFYELTPYQYASNDPVSKIDLDGGEGIFFQEVQDYLLGKTVQNPEGWQAKTLGVEVGVGGSIMGVANGLAHPGTAIKGLGRMLTQSPGQNAMDYGLSLYSQYGNSGSDAFTNYAIYAHALTDVAIALSPIKEGGLAKDGTLINNAFDGLTSITDIGKTGEALTKGVLESQFKGAEILEQVNIKMDGASTTADFVVVKNGKVEGVFESKVNGSKLSNGLRLLYNDKEVGTLTGKNAGRLQGVTIDPSKLKTGVYRWDTKTGSFNLQ